MKFLYYIDTTNCNSSYFVGPFIVNINQCNFNTIELNKNNKLNNKKMKQKILLLQDEKLKKG